MHLVTFVFVILLVLYVLGVGVWAWPWIFGAIAVLLLAGKFRNFCGLGAMLPYSVWHFLGVLEDIGDKLAIQARRWKYMLFMTSVVFLYGCFADIIIVLCTEHLGKMLLLLVVTAGIIGASQVHHQLEESAPDEVAACLHKSDRFWATLVDSCKWLYAIVTKKLVPGDIKQDELQTEFKGLFEKAEYEVLSGICIEMPCCDQYAPNTSGCCWCCPPTYNETVYKTATDFYDKVLPELHTGDIYLAAFPRQACKEANFMLHTKWTHVGIIYRRSDCPEVLKQQLRQGGAPQDNSTVDDSRPLVAEVLDYGNPAVPAFTLSDFEACTLQYLAQKPSWYYDEVARSGSAAEAEKLEPFMVAVRTLRNPDGTPFTRDKEFYQRVEEAITSNLACKYAFNQLPLALNFGQWTIPYLKKMNVPHADSLEKVFLAENDKDAEGNDLIFCGEFVADVYQKAGLLDVALNKNEFAPVCYDSSRHLCLRNAKLSKEHVLVGLGSKEDRQRPEWAARYDENFAPAVNRRAVVLSSPGQQTMYEPPKPVPAGEGAPEGAPEGGGDGGSDDEEMEETEEQKMLRQMGLPTTFG